MTDREKEIRAGLADGGDYRLDDDLPVYDAAQGLLGEVGRMRAVVDAAWWECLIGHASRDLRRAVAALPTEPEEETEDQQGGTGETTSTA